MMAIKVLFYVIYKIWHMPVGRFVQITAFLSLSLV